jgi:hypothetical protein
MLDAAPVGEYSGGEACRSCHPDEFARQSKSEHARALALAPRSQTFLRPTRIYLLV